MNSEKQTVNEFQPPYGSIKNCFSLLKIQAEEFLGTLRKKLNFNRIAMRQTQEEETISPVKVNAGDIKLHGALGCSPAAVKRLSGGGRRR